MIRVGRKHQQHFLRPPRVAYHDAHLGKKSDTAAPLAAREHKHIPEAPHDVIPLSPQQTGNSECHRISVPRASNDPPGVKLPFFLKQVPPQVHRK